MASFNPQTSQRLAKHLKSLHSSSHPLVLTNIHDAPTCSLALSHPKTQAIATASFAIAAVAGVPDEELDLATNLSAVDKIRKQMVKDSKHETVPLTVDLQDGYGDLLEEAIEKMIKLGVVGCNLEDSRMARGEDGKARIELLKAETHVLRIETALRVAARLGVPDFVINARTDVVKLGGTVGEAIERGKLYLGASATTIFVMADLKRSEVKELVEGLEGKVNVLYRRSAKNTLSVKEIGALGVARVSMGPGLWREGMAAMRKEMERILDGE